MKALMTIIVIGLLSFTGLEAAVARPQEAQDGRFARIHLRAGISLVTTGFPSALSRDLDRWGFGDDSYTWFIIYITTHHPRISSDTRYAFQAEYSITRKIALGLTMLSLGKARGDGYDYLGPVGQDPLDMGNTLDVSVRGTAYLLGASYSPALSAGRRLSARAGLGIGIADVETTFETNIETKVYKGKPLCGLVLAGLDLRVFSPLTVGLTVQYRYVPFKTGEFEISSEYQDYYNMVVKPYQIPSSGYGLSGLELGMGIGLHF
jgi:hypothetical protein